MKAAAREIREIQTVLAAGTRKAAAVGARRSMTAAAAKMKAALGRQIFRYYQLQEPVNS